MSSAARHTSSMAAQVVCCGAVLIPKRMYGDYDLDRRSRFACDARRAPRNPGRRGARDHRIAFGFCALHGGLEQGTAEIAEAAAGAAGASFYAVVQPDDLRWHIPSHRYDPTASQALREFVAHVDIVISVHGFGGVRDADDRWTTALLGGSNRELAHDFGTRACGGAAGLPLDRRSRHHSAATCAGCTRTIPSTASRGGGVQLELPPRVRRAGPRLRRARQRACSSGSRCATSL